MCCYLFFLQTSRVVAIAAYKDVSGIFTMSEQSGINKHVNPDDDDVTESKATASKSGEAEDADASTEAIDEDELLYGDTSSSALPEPVTIAKTTKDPIPTVQSHLPVNDVTPTYWAVLATESGELEIYSLPDFSLVYFVKNFCVAPQLLLNALCNDVENIPKTK